jgi:hypothetical protein
MRLLKGKTDLVTCAPSGIEFYTASALAYSAAAIDRATTLSSPQTANPTVNAFIGIPKGTDGRLDCNRLETAINYGFRIVGWHLDEDMAI